MCIVNHHIIYKNKKEINKLFIRNKIFHLVVGVNSFSFPFKKKKNPQEEKNNL